MVMAFGQVLDVADEQVLLVGDAILSEQTDRGRQYEGTADMTSSRGSMPSIHSGLSLSFFALLTSATLGLGARAYEG